jgi:hypothetical protein
VSGLWTPSGEHVPERDEPGAPPDAPSPEEEAAVAEELRRVRQEIAGTPVADIIANHAVGLWQLAILHLTPEDGDPSLEEAALAIDALAALVEQLGDRLGHHAEALREALTQLRLAFVEVRNRAGGDAPGGADSDEAGVTPE